MSSYEQVKTEDRRLVILLLLKESDGYRCNEFLLNDLLNERGHAVSQDRVRSDLDWLQEQGLLKVQDIHDTRIATINQRGVDVAGGRITVSGVKRPRAGG